MLVEKVPKEGINHIRPAIKLSRAPLNHASDDWRYCDMESVPVRNPLNVQF